MTEQQEIKITEELESRADDKADIFMAIQALGQLKNSQPPPPPPPPTTTTTSQQQETFLDKVTSYPLISNSIKMIEKNIQDNKRRWFQEEPQKLQNLKELSLANINIESRRKLQMLINFLKLGNKQLNLRVENLAKICEQERLKKLSNGDINALGSTKDDTEEEEDDDEEEEEFHDATDSVKITQLNTSHSPSPELSSARIASKSPSPSQQEQQQPHEIKSEIVGTVKKIVKVVSKFTGNSLPEPARSHVRELLLKLPTNWATQKDMISKDQLDPNGKVLVLAQESLDMIRKILNLCNENLSSLENWNYLKVEEQKFLKEKILIKNHNYYYVTESKIEERDEEVEEVEEEQVKKRFKIGIDDLVNDKNTEQIQEQEAEQEQHQQSLPQLQDEIQDGTQDEKEKKAHPSLL